MEGKLSEKDGTEVTFSNKPMISTYARNWKHLCQHPVISLNGGTLCSEDCIDSFRMMIMKAYRLNKHVYDKMISVKNATADVDEKIMISHDMKLYLRYSSGTVKNVQELKSSIILLSKFLVKYYSTGNVVILYDEYDAHLRNLYLTRGLAFTNEKKYKKLKFNNFLHDFMFATFKENQYLFRGVITGILNVEEATFLSNLNFVECLSVFQLGKTYHNFYGVAGYELKEMMVQRGINESMQNQVIDWYDGYRDIDYPEEPLYSVYSITGFLNNLELQSYWGAQSFNSILITLLAQSEFLNDYAIFRSERDLQISSCMFKKMLECNYQTFRKLSMGEMQYYSVDHKTIVFTVMVVLGFASISKKVDDNLYVRIPNKEIETEFKKTESQVMLDVLQISPEFR